MVLSMWTSPHKPVHRDRLAHAHDGGNQMPDLRAAARLDSGWRLGGTELANPYARAPKGFANGSFENRGWAQGGSPKRGWPA